MSGICAIARRDGRPTDQQLLAAMINLMSDRGPDEQSYWMDGPIALGHTLLKTTYESATERQPSTLDGKVWVTADARIDDRGNLIEKLRGLGHNIDAKASDDVLILHAYGAWNIDCLDHLIGDFGFAIWDGAEQQLVCATDQFGVVPLYFAAAGDDFLCSNSLNCLRLHCGVSDALDEQAIADNLLFRMNYNPHGTTFADVQKLPAAHRLVWKAGALDVAPYWRFEKQPYQRKSKREYVEEFSEIFRSAVEDRLRCDGAGAHISGGMDSTSIAAVLSQQRRQEVELPDIRGYTLVLSDGSLALEKPYAELVARKLHIPLQFLQGSEDDFLGVPLLEEAGDVSPEPGLLRRDSSRRDICDDVSSYSRILFTGYGGDPVFSPDFGYWAGLKEAGNWGTLASDAFRHFIIHRRMPSNLVPMARLSRARRNSAKFDMTGWLDVDFARRNDVQGRVEQRANTLSSGVDGRATMISSPLWRRLFEWNDPGFSGSPVKLRHPFFDLRLLEWAQSTPPVPWFHHKYILREAMRDLLPREVLERPKRAIPGNKRKSLMREPEFAERFTDLLNEPSIQPFIDHGAVLDGFSNAQNGSLAASKAVIRIKSLAIWLKYYKHPGTETNKNSIPELERYVRRSQN